jgi:hypothetical protein
MDSLPPKLLEADTWGVELAGGLLHAVTSKREQEDAAEDVSTAFFFAPFVCVACNPNELSHIYACVPNVQ